MKRTRIPGPWLLASVLAGFTGAVHAGGCTLSTTGLAFGAYQPLTFSGKLISSDRTSDASVSLVCTGIASGGSYSVALGPSVAGGSSLPRYLSNAAGGRTWRSTSTASPATPQCGATAEQAAC